MDATAANSLNSIDLFIAIIMATIICSGARRGIITEIFKLLGIFCTIFVSLHYYESFADFLRVQFFGKKASTEFFAFSLLAVLIYVLFLLISSGWVHVLKFKIHEKINRYGGIILGFVRSYFAAGLVIFTLLLADHGIATPMTRRSISRNIFGYVAADSYRATHEALIAKFFPNEPLNGEVFKLVSRKHKKKKTNKKK